jgi:hypothetical protein
MAWPADALQAGTIVAPNLRGLKPWLSDTFKNRASGMPVDASRGYRNGLYFLHAAGGEQVAAPLPMDRATPPNPKGSAFACEVVGKVDGPAGRWGLTLIDDGTPRFSISIAVAGTLSFHKGGTGELRVLDPGKHPAIHKGAKSRGQANRLLLLIHERYVELYVNNQAVCHPFLLVKPIAVPQFALLCAAPRKRGATAELESVVVVPVPSLPSLESRGAKPTGK